MSTMTHSTEQERLDKIAPDYDFAPFDTQMRDYMMRALAPFLTSGPALEMGCLHGEFTQILADHFPDLTVVEAVAEFIERTRKRVPPRVQFVQSLFEDYSPKAQFDAIFSLHILEHLQDPVGILSKAKSFLTPGGRLFLVVPNGNAPSRQIAVKMGVLPHLAALSEADIKHGHRRVYFLDTLARDAQAAGLKVIHRGGIFFKPLANFQFDALMGGPLISDAFMEGCYQLGFEHPTLCASIFVVCEA